MVQEPQTHYRLRTNVGALQISIAAMDFEIATDMWLQEMLGSFHCNPSGMFVEVGLGASNWSFPWASDLGLTCVAVEPCPTPLLRETCRRDGVKLIEAAVCRQAGTTLLYQGEIDGNKLGDVNSIRSDWWGAGSSAQTVEAVSLSGLASTWDEHLFMCVKVDVEGAEADVLSSLVEFEPRRLPKFVAFEYGGGGSKRSGRGGWTEEFATGTMNCLALLKELRYTGGVVLDTTRWAPRFFNLSELDANVDTPFFPSDEVGNIIVWREAPDAGSRKRGLLRHYWLQARCSLDDIRKHFLFWMRHWRIRAFCWMKKWF